MFSKGYKFEISDTQYDKINDWYNTHECTLTMRDGHKYVGTIGGAVSITFLPTSIGVLITAKCACGCELTVSGIF